MTLSGVPSGASVSKKGRRPVGKTKSGDRLERAIDTRLLRDLFVRQLPDATAMPTAQGALFALRNVDTRLADAVLERAATHYRVVA
jgi:hypothetical protein